MSLHCIEMQRQRWQNEPVRVKRAWAWERQRARMQVAKFSKVALPTRTIHIKFLRYNFFFFWFLFVCLLVICVSVYVVARLCSWCSWCCRYVVAVTVCKYLCQQIAWSTTNFLHGCGAVCNRIDAHCTSTSTFILHSAAIQLHLALSSSLTISRLLLLSPKN